MVPEAGTQADIPLAGTRAEIPLAGTPSASLAFCTEAAREMATATGHAR